MQHPSEYLTPSQYRIYLFLSEYINFNWEIGRITKSTLKYSIHLLIVQNVFSAEELRAECLEKQSVIIPWDYFDTYSEGGSNEEI